MGIQSITVLVIMVSSLCHSYPWPQQQGDSKCPGTTCSPAAPGVVCEPRYERDDGCCPVWHCANGQTIYGKQSGASSGSFSSWSSSSGGGMPQMPGMSMPGFSINLPFFGRR